MLRNLIEFCVRQPLLTVIGAVFVAAIGGYCAMVVPVDAIPNVGENQVIVFTEWPGRSPIGMQWFDIDANIMSLAGIAIAIGEVADLGIIISENVYQHLVEWEASQTGNDQASAGTAGQRDARSRPEVIIDATYEVAPAVMTGVSTTIVSFLPVFFLTGRCRRGAGDGPARFLWHVYRTSVAICGASPLLRLHGTQTEFGSNQSYRRTCETRRTGVVHFYGRDQCVIGFGELPANPDMHLANFRKE